MKIRCGKWIFSIFLILVLCCEVSADVPKILNYEGTLTDTSGNPVPNGTYDIQFSIYSVPVEGEVLWSEHWNSSTEQVIVTNGKFNVMLGTHNPFKAEFFDNLPAAYLGVKVGLDPEMSPRQRLASVAYSFTAGSGGIPKGGIIMWSGSINDIPKGWVLCDGQNGTPDLRDRFIVGAGMTYTMSNPIGGTASHSHSCSGTTSLESRTEFVQKLSSGTGNEMADDKHTHSFSCTTNESNHIPPYYVLAFIMKQ